MGKWAEKWAKKGHFRVCPNWRFFKARFSALVGWDMPKLQWVSCIELSVSTSMMRCRNPGSRDSK